jgi:hypothetical protein
MGMDLNLARFLGVAWVFHGSKVNAFQNLILEVLPHFVSSNFVVYD